MASSGCRHSTDAAVAQMKMAALTHPNAMGKALAPKRSINAPTIGGPMIVPPP